jgi:hypothetical protein
MTLRDFLSGDGGVGVFNFFLIGDFILVWDCGLLMPIFFVGDFLVKFSKVGFVDYVWCGVVLFFLGMEAGGCWRFFLGMLRVGGWVGGEFRHVCGGRRW